jgi:hypothetical protein
MNDFCAVQVLGVITSTIGVAIAFNKFDALNDEMTHTKLGVAIMVLVWVQVLLSVIRPKRYAQFQHNCSCCYLPIYIFTESQNYSLLIPSMLDRLFSTNSLEYVRIIFRSENSQTLLADWEKYKNWKFFFSGKGNCPNTVKAFFLGREFVWGLWKLLFGEGNLSKVFERSFFWKWICVRILKAFLLGREFVQWLW